MIRAIGVLLLSGCLEVLAPDVGPAQQSGICAGDSDPARVVSYRDDIETGVFVDNGCIRCHTGNGLGIRQSGLSLDSYTLLRGGGGRSGSAIVIDGNPCYSVLVQKLESGPPFGRRMPYDGPPYLSSDEVALVRDWIFEGARDN